MFDYLRRRINNRFESGRRCRRRPRRPTIYAVQRERLSFEKNQRWIGFLLHQNTPVRGSCAPQKIRFYTYTRFRSSAQISHVFQFSLFSKLNSKPEPFSANFHTANLKTNKYHVHLPGRLYFPQHLAFRLPLYDLKVPGISGHVLSRGDRKISRLDNGNPKVYF